MATVDQARSTLDDLMRTEGKAELIGGRIVTFMPTGFLPNRVASRIWRSLSDYCDLTGDGEAFTDGVGYAVKELRSGRESFCPDASYFAGQLPSNPMKFLQGPPAFAVEVRSEGDYGPSAEREMAAKRTDYFEAGTRVVWDVDPEAGTVVSYSSDDPATPRTFRRGQVPHAEPALLGWRVGIDHLFA